MFSHLLNSTLLIWYSQSPQSQFCRFILEETHQPEIKSPLTAVLGTSRDKSAEMSRCTFVKLSAVKKITLLFWSLCQLTRFPSPLSTQVEISGFVSLQKTPFAPIYSCTVWKMSSTKQHNPSENPKPSFDFCGGKKHLIMCIRIASRQSWVIVYQCHFKLCSAFCKSPDTWRIKVRILSFRQKSPYRHCFMSML